MNICTIQDNCSWNDKAIVSAVSSPLLQHNHTGEDPSRLFAITQRCPKSLLLPSSCQLCKWEKWPRFCDGQIAENTSVEMNTGLREVVNEGRILQAVFSRCCCNACDPERPHVTFFEHPRFSGVDERSGHRSHSQTVASVLSASEVPRMFENFLHFPESIRSSVSDPAG